MYILKKIPALFFLIFFAKTSFAQNNYIKNEIELAYGIATSPEIPGATGNFFDADNNHTRVDNISGIGGFSLAYNRYISNRFSVGVTGIYTKATVTYRVPSAKFDWAIFTALLNAKYNYVHDPLFHMYSGLSAGCSFNNIIGSAEGKNDAFAYQLRLLGARFGAKFGAFAELGYGYEGILKAGVSLEF
ncbi:MAG: hypothetical protein IT249_03335 [Chitinophagaceae bacterium]|nr:hypothetical protein [Chitinophagaceae bacterium]